MYPLGCGILVHKHCQDRAPICRDLSKPGQQVTMGTEVVVRQPEELDELAQFLVEKVISLSLSLTLSLSLSLSLSLIHSLVILPSVSLFLASYALSTNVSIISSGQNRTN